MEEGEERTNERDAERERGSWGRRKKVDGRPRISFLFLKAAVLWSSSQGSTGGWAGRWRIASCPKNRLRASLAGLGQPPGPAASCPPSGPGKAMETSGWKRHPVSAQRNGKQPCMQGDGVWPVTELGWTFGPFRAKSARKGIILRPLPQPHRRRCGTQNGRIVKDIRSLLAFFIRVVRIYLPQHPS